MRTRPYLLVLITYLLALQAPAAIASTPVTYDFDDDTIIDEIIVTAERRPASAADTAISLSAFDADALSTLGIEESSDISDYVPNLTIRKTTSSDDNLSYAIRGVVEGDPSLFAESAIGVYVDGIYQSRLAGAAYEFLPLERVEVLRGPQGVLYGRNNIGGAINFISRKPSEETAMIQRFTTGTRGRRKALSLLDTGEIYVGNVALLTSLSYLRSDFDGTLKNTVNGSTLGDKESRAYSLTTQALINDRVDAVYRLFRTKKEGVPEISQLTAIRDNALSGPIFNAANSESSDRRVGAVQRFFAAGIGKGARSDLTSHALTITHSGEVEWKSITGYQEWSRSTDVTDFGSFLSDGSVLSANADFSVLTPIPAGEPVSLFRARQHSEQHQFSQEFQVSGTVKSHFEYVAGVFYFEEKVYESNPQSFLIAGTPEIVANVPVFSYGGDVRSYAAFGHLTIPLPRNTAVQAGLRYTADKKTAFLQQSNIGGGASPIDASDRWHNLNPTVTLKHDWNDQLMLYGSMASGFRAGGFNARATEASTFKTPFDEEHLLSYELGWKYNAPDRRWRLNGALFYLEYEDRQVTQFAAGTMGASTVIKNAGKQISTGIELDAAVKATPGLTLELHYGYTDAAFKEFVTGLVDPQTGEPIPGADAVDAVDNPLAPTLRVPSTPRQTGSLRVRYDIDHKVPGTLSLHVSANYTDEIAFVPLLNELTMADDYTIVNAAIQWSEIKLGDGELTVRGWGKNITNEEIRLWGVDFGALGFAVNTYAELASFGIDIQYEL